MTKDEKIEKAVEAVSNKFHLDVRSLVEKIIDAIESEDEPADNIPIGHPCEFQHPDNNHQLAYFKEDGRLTAHKELATISYGGFPAKDKRPLTIWDIDKKYGGAPDWAIAWAHKREESVWIRFNPEITYYTHRDYTIERRPEGN